MFNKFLTKIDKLITRANEVKLFNSAAGDDSNLSPNPDGSGGSGDGPTTSQLDSSKSPRKYSSPLADNYVPRRNSRTTNASPPGDIFPYPNAAELTDEERVEKVKESDGNFFENFTALQWKAENRKLQSDASAIGTPITDRKKLGVKPGQICQMSKQQQELLYLEVLYTVKHKIGATTGGHTPFVNDLYSYSQQAFNVTTEDQVKLLAKAGEEKPPITILNLVVIEAKDVIAKDADGFSDPYCMLGIIPGQRLDDDNNHDGNPPKSENQKELLPASPTQDLSHSKEDLSSSPCSLEPKKGTIKKNRLSFRKKKEKDKTPEAIPAKLIRATAVCYNTLNPKWNEKFKFDIDDVQSDMFHLDIWDHDDEEKSVVDAVKKLNEISSLKGLGRYFKQVAQSARTGEDESVDDFLGCVSIKMKDIPSVGVDTWYPLEGRSAKSAVRGSIHLKMWLGTREDRGQSEEDNLSEIRQHEALIRIIMEHEVKQLGGDASKWAGQLPQAALTLLHQHAIQGDITDVQQAMCHWLACAKIQKSANLNYSLMLTKFRNLDKLWDVGVLAREEEEFLAASFGDFLTNAYELILKHRTVFPGNSKESLDRLENLLQCVGVMQSSELLKKCLPFQKDFKTEVKGLIKKGAIVFYEKTKKSADSLNSSQNNTSLTYLCESVNVLCHQCVNFYHKVFYRTTGINYFWTVYREWDRLLINDFVSNHVQMPDDLSEIQTLVGTFELYLALSEFERFRNELDVSEDEKRDQLSQTDFENWIEKSVRMWLKLAKEKCNQRIDLAVKLDRQVPRSDSSDVKHSTSYIDVCYCFQQMIDFWHHLYLPMSLIKAEFIQTVTENMCKSGTHYVDQAFAMLAHTEFYDDSVPLTDPVVDQLCIAVNNAEQVRRVLKELPDQFKFDEIITFVEKVEKQKIDNDQKPIKVRLNGPIKEMNAEILEQIDMALNKLADKQKGNLKKHIFHLAWSAEACPVDKAIQPLLDSIDQRVLNYHKWLLKGNFIRLLRAHFRAVLSEIKAMVIENNGQEATLNKKLAEGMNVLVEFFHADGKGPSREVMEDEFLYKELSAVLKFNQKITTDLISMYYSERYKAQDDCNDCKFGFLSVRAYYNRNAGRLVVDVVNAQNIIALDTNGLSDPFVIVELVPHQRFPSVKPTKTKVVDKSLNPVFEENFEFPVNLSQVPKAAMVHFLVMDHDFLLTNDFAGEAFLPLDDIPGVANNGGSSEKIKPFTLTLIHPNMKNPIVSALENRKEDREAVEFVRHLEQIRRT